MGRRSSSEEDEEERGGVLKDGEGGGGLKEGAESEAEVKARRQKIAAEKRKRAMEQMATLQRSFMNVRERESDFVIHSYLRAH